jgi:hypothetical protein
MNSGFGEEPLSLGTFDPQNAQAPYLNTPRSLEACHRFGINPIELVEVSPEEFRKDAPDDPDAAQRRFERIDGARRTMLTNVVVEWKSICDSDWEPARRPPTSGRERILNVRPEAHSTLLEIQAEKFRKIEENQFKGLQRMLSISVMKADEEVKNKAILDKHAEQKAAGDERAAEMQRRKEELFRQMMEDKKKKEADEAARIKVLQEMDAKEAKEKIRIHEEKMKKEKDMRERREAERLQREQYTKDLKKSIMEQMEIKANQRQKLADLKTAESNQRKAESEEQRKKDNKKRQLDQERRQNQARQEAKAKAEGERNDMLDRIRADEMKRNRLKEQRELERRLANEAGNAEGEEKRKSRKATADNVLNGKISKTQAELKFKDMLAQKELEKVKAARQRRQQLKEIRQEAFDLAAARRKKAKDYQDSKQKKAIRDKDDKCQAIQDGFKTLSHMRNKMRDIMDRATIELKGEIHHLQHKGQLSPDKVITRSIDISKKSLFPNLKKQFGLTDPTSAAEEARLSEMLAGDEAAAAKTMSATAAAATADNTNRPSSPSKLPIKNMGIGKLEDSLYHTRRKQINADAEEEARLEAKKARSQSPSRSRGGSPTTRSPQKGDTKTPGGGTTRGRIGNKKTVETEADGMGGTNGMRSAKSTFMEEGKDEFRREYSSDHPLAPGGKGKYKTEAKTGKNAKTVKKMSYEEKNTYTPSQAAKTVERLSLQSQNPVVDPEKHLEQLRREQNQALIRVLEEERGAEESRERMAFAVLSEQEAQRMELVFAEERRRASERIVTLTKEHEKRIKDAVLSMSNLKKHK